MGFGTFNASLGENDIGVVDVAFSFNTAGSSDPDEDDTYGKKVASIVHTSTGKYTVTMSGCAHKILYKSAKLDDSSSPNATADDATVYCADETADPLVLVVHTTQSAAAHDFTDRRVNVLLKLKLSSGA